MTEMVERVARVLSSIDCEKQYRGMVMDRVDDKWVISAELAPLLARAALTEVRAIFDKKANAAEFQSDRDYELHTAVAAIDEALK